MPETSGLLRPLAPTRGREPTAKPGADTQRGVPSTSSTFHGDLLETDCPYSVNRFIVACDPGKNLSAPARADD
jgi:hypothetical protein